jgi:hypothetical protein
MVKRMSFFGLVFERSGRWPSVGGKRNRVRGGGRERREGGREGRRVGDM